MTDFHLIRHGETHWNEQGRKFGRIDIPLNNMGRLQTMRLIPELTIEEFTAIYTSPLRRASESAEIIAKALGLDAPVTCRDLIERSFGMAEGMYPHELARAYPDGNIEGRETNLSVATRAWNALYGIHREMPDGVVIVVTHSGVIRSLIEAITGDAHIDQLIPNGSRQILRVVEGQGQLLRFEGVPR